MSAVGYTPLGSGGYLSKVGASLDLNKHVASSSLPLPCNPPRLPLLGGTLPRRHVLSTLASTGRW